MADYIGQTFYIKPTYLVSLPEFAGNIRGRSAGQRLTESNLKQNSTKGKLSRKSQSKLKNAVNWLCSSAKAKALYSKKYNKFFYFKVNFITLTIPLHENNLVNEKTAKRCLHAWLSYARKYFYLRNYVWKFEATKANQLHVHLTTDTYIHYAKIRKSWNRVLEANNLLTQFQKEHGHNNPNSTDVHAVRKVKDIAAYISKYMAKSKKEMPGYKGRIWACNREISEANTCKTTIFRNDSDIAHYVLMDKKTEYRPIMSPPNALGQTKEIGQLFFMNEKIWKQLQLSAIKAAYDNHRYHIRNNLEALPEEYWEASINEYFEIYGNNTKLQRSKIPDVPPDGTVYTLLSNKRSRKGARSLEKNVDQLEMAYL